MHLDDLNLNHDPKILQKGENFNLLETSSEIQIKMSNYLMTTLI